VLVDVDADNLAFMEDFVYNASSSSRSSSSSSLEDHPNSASGAPLEDMKTEPPNEEPNPDAADAAMPDSCTTPLQSVGDSQQTLGDGPPQPPKESTNLGPASADLGGWV